VCVEVLELKKGEEKGGERDILLGCARGAGDQLCQQQHGELGGGGGDSKMCRGGAASVVHQSCVALVSALTQG
jgi:hypothetical protein